MDQETGENPKQQSLPQPLATQIPQQQPQGIVPNQLQTSAVTPKQQSNTIPILIAVICLLGIGVLGGYLIATKNTSSDPTQQAPQKVNGDGSLNNAPSVNGTQTQSETAKHDGMTMTVTPGSGPIGSAVTVTLEGVPPKPIFIEGGILFIDSAKGLGYPISPDQNGNQNQQSVPDPSQLGKTTFKILIPNTVYVQATPNEQRPSKAVPVSAGQGRLRYLYNDGSTKSEDGGFPYVEVPFTITSPL